MPLLIAGSMTACFIGGMWRTLKDSVRIATCQCLAVRFGASGAWFCGPDEILAHQARAVFGCRSMVRMVPSRSGLKFRTQQYKTRTAM